MSDVCIGGGILLLCLPYALGGQNVGLEYRFNPHLSVESQIGTTRDSGIDAVFTWDIK